MISLSFYLNCFASSPPNNGMNPNTNATSRFRSVTPSAIWNKSFIPGTNTTISSSANPKITE